MSTVTCLSLIICVIQFLLDKHDIIRVTTTGILNPDIPDHLEAKLHGSGYVPDPPASSFIGSFFKLIGYLILIAVIVGLVGLYVQRVNRKSSKRF